MGLILASGSPRRRQMLERCGIPLADIRPANIDESRRAGEAPVAYARRLAVEKASAIPAAGHWVLSADTVVHIDDQIFDKPTDDDDAFRILRGLSGGWHEVTSAWCLQWGGGPPVPVALRSVEHVTTRVRCRDLTDEEIHNYILSGESRDKAGAYGIQGLGAVLVAEVQGSYTNVVGLPLEPVMAALTRAGFSPKVME
ncbi:MAG: Maf family protein [Myxococcota bacterium]